MAPLYTHVKRFGILKLTC